MSRSPRHVLAIVVACTITFVVGRVVAAGFPSTGTELFYSGQLTNDSGAPLVTVQELIVQFFDAPTGGSELCATESTEVDLAPTFGGFRIALPAECVGAVADNGDVWAQLVVSGTRMPRQKIGATPYAIVAREAQSAAVAEIAIEASRAQSVADGAVGTRTLANGAVTLEKTDFANRFDTEIASIESRLDAAEQSIESLPQNQPPIVKTVTVSESNLPIFPTQSSGNFTWASFPLDSSGGLWRASLAGTASQAFTADNGGGAGCNGPSSNQGYQVRIDGLSFFNKFTFEFPFAEISLSTIPSGPHIVTVVTGGVTPGSGCLSPKLQRNANFTLILEEVGTPSP